jgi:hypothetical protein
MSSYIYSKLQIPQSGEPVEFYSELDAQRYETRKMEIFTDGSARHASPSRATSGSLLSVIPVPPIAEISPSEFDTREISKDEFETKWNEVTKT